MRSRIIIEPSSRNNNFRPKVPCCVNYQSDDLSFGVWLGSGGKTAGIKFAKQLAKKLKDLPEIILRTGRTSETAKVETI